MSNYSFTRTDQPVEAPVARNHTLAERVYRTLHEEIVSGALRPGQRLVRRELSSRLGVSPMLAAEALLRLELDGLVESRPLHGARVRPLTVEDYRGEELLREALECLAARMCAENASNAELAKLMVLAQTVDRVSAQSSRQSKPGIEMHRQTPRGHCAMWEGGAIGGRAPSGMDPTTRPAEVAGPSRRGAGRLAQGAHRGHCQPRPGPGRGEDARARPLPLGGRLSADRESGGVARVIGRWRNHALGELLKCAPSPFGRGVKRVPSALWERGRG